MTTLFALRNSIRAINTEYKNGQEITEFSIGGTTLIIRTKFAPNIHTGEVKPTVYCLNHVPLSEVVNGVYTYEKSILIVSNSLEDLLNTFASRVWENTPYNFVVTL
jgi:hypothetical protein